MKIIKHFAYSLVFLCCFLTRVLPGVLGTSKDHRVVQVTSLRLYSFLQEIKAVMLKLNTNMAEVHADATKQTNVTDVGLRSCLTIEQVFDESLMLMKEIIEGFNTGMLEYNPEVEYKFVSMCNTLKDVSHIEARHLRLLKKKIHKFDEYLQSYCVNTRDFLSVEEKAFFNKMIRLDYFLTNILLRNEFLENSFFQKFKDWFFYKPGEWMEDHPGLVITGLAVLVVGGCLLLVYPELKKKD